MIGDYLKDRFQDCVIWGIVLQCSGGLVPLGPERAALAVLGWLAIGSGTLLTVVGFAYYARTKGRSPAWAVLALASVFGWVVLVLLKPKPTHVVSGSGLQRGI